MGKKQTLTWKQSELLQRCRRHEISISKKKFTYANSEVKYVGFTVGQKGIEADPDTDSRDPGFRVPADACPAERQVGAGS